MGVIDFLDIYLNFYLIYFFNKGGWVINKLYIRFVVKLIYDFLL